MVEIRRLKEALLYKPETGKWRWIINISHCRVGSRAGHRRKRGYNIIRIDGKDYLSHRLAWFYMTGRWPKEQIDHINGDPSDNRWDNLREATGFQNHANSRKPITNTSGLKGVSWSKESKKWQAQIKSHCKSTHLGFFDSKEEAHAAYVTAAKVQHGAFANAG